MEWLAASVAETVSSAREALLNPQHHKNLRSTLKKMQAGAEEKKQHAAAWSVCLLCFLDVVVYIQYTK